MTAPDRMPEAFENSLHDAGIRTWSLRQTRGGSEPRQVFSVGLAGILFWG